MALADTGSRHTGRGDRKAAASAGTLVDAQRLAAAGGDQRRELAVADADPGDQADGQSVQKGTRQLFLSAIQHFQAV